MRKKIKLFVSAKKIQNKAFKVTLRVTLRVTKFSLECVEFIKNVFKKSLKYTKKGLSRWGYDNNRITSLFYKYLIIKYLHIFYVFLHLFSIPHKWVYSKKPHKWVLQKAYSNTTFVIRTFTVNYINP